MGRGTAELANAGVGLAILLGLALGRGWGHGERAAQVGQTPLRLAYFPNLTHAPALIGVDAGRYAEALPNVHLETRVVNAGPEAMEALLAGEVDMAFVGPSPAHPLNVKRLTAPLIRKPAREVRRKSQTESVVPSS